MTQYDLFPPAEGQRGNVVRSCVLTPRDCPDRLPPELRHFTRPSTVELPGMPGPVPVTASHGGSHPHLVHEFISSIVERRPPAVDATRAARWTAPGICAHASALEGGETISVPHYE